MCHWKTIAIKLGINKLQTNKICDWSFSFFKINCKKKCKKVVEKDCFEEKISLGINQKRKVGHKMGGGLFRDNTEKSAVLTWLRTLLRTPRMSKHANFWNPL